MKTLLYSVYSGLKYYCIYVDSVDLSISNPFNVIYVKAVDTKHINFQSEKSFGKLRLRAFQLYHQYYIYIDTVDTRQGSVMHSILSMLTLSIQNTSTHSYP